MAIDRSKYYHGPTAAVIGQNTPGYAYASIYLKNREDQWSLAQKQAASEIAQGDTRYKLLMDSYQKRMAGLDDRMKALDKSIADAAGDSAKALNAVEIQRSKNALTDAKQKADWEIAKAETMAVAQPSQGGSVSHSEGTGSGGGMGGGEYKNGVGSISKDADKIIGGQKALVGDDPVTLARSYEEGPEMAGFVSVSDSKGARDGRYGVVSTSVDAAETKVLKENPSIDPRDAKLIAETEVLERLKAGGMGDFASAYSTVKSALPPEGEGTGGTSTHTTDSSSWRSGGGAVQKLRNPGLKEMPVGKAAEIKVADTATATADIKKAKEDLQKEINALKPPDMSSTDWITRSREIMAGRFGPVQASPNFYQRNTVQGLQAYLDHPVVQEAYKAWKASMPQPVTGGTTTSPATLSTATTPVSARDGSVISPEAAPIPSNVSDVQYLFPEGLPPELQAKVDALRTPTNRPPMDVLPKVSQVTPPVMEEQPVPDVPVRIMRAIPAPAAPGVKPVPPAEFEPTPKESPAQVEPTADAVVTPQPTVRAPSVVTYYQNRVEDAVKLTSQPDKLARLSASGAGKVARDLYQANASSGQPFQETYEELTLTFGGDEEALKQAHTVALALDMAAKKATAPPKE